MSQPRALLVGSLLLASPAAADDTSPSAPSQPSSPAPCAEPTSAWLELCDPPWVLDASGIRRVLPECLTLVRPVPTAAFELVPATASTLDAACQPPYHIDPRGIQRLLPECLTLELPPPLFAPLPAASEAATPAAVAQSPSCELPYRIDASGIRRLRLECL